MGTEIRRLVTQCLAHDPSAVGQLISQFRGRVFSLCYRMLGQWQDAEDVSQETLWRAVRYLGQWDADREFEPWLLTIAANRCRSLLARRMKRLDMGPRQPTDPLDWSHLEQHAAAGLAEEVTCILAELPPDWQTAFRLFHEEGLGYDDMAKRMGRPVGTVKSWVHRTRLALLEHLERREVVVRTRRNPEVDDVEDDHLDRSVDDSPPSSLAMKGDQV